jgi:hypothetical protein
MGLLRAVSSQTFEAWGIIAARQTQFRSLPMILRPPARHRCDWSTQPYANGGPGHMKIKSAESEYRGRDATLYCSGRGRTETTGQAPREGQQDRRGERNSEQERGKTDQPQRPQRNEQNRTTGHALREGRLNRAPEQNRTRGQAPRDDRTNRPPEQNRLEQERDRTDRTEENRAATGQGAAGTRSGISLTQEKRTQIHEMIVHERNASRVSRPDFSISFGARVPRTVRFAALPRTILEIEPARARLGIFHDRGSNRDRRSEVDGNSGGSRGIA